MAHSNILMKRRPLWRKQLVKWFHADRRRRQTIYSHVGHAVMWGIVEQFSHILPCSFFVSPNFFVHRKFFVMKT